MATNERTLNKGGEGDPRRYEAVPILRVGSTLFVPRIIAKYVAVWKEGPVSEGICIAKVYGDEQETRTTIQLDIPHRHQA